jgi:hypothetical protein
MPFEEALKASVRRRAHFACCLCHDLGVEIHHVVPEAEGGANAEENAAPLCPSCHERYGANPVKRKFIREARDFWFEICDERYGDDPRFSEIQTTLDGVATKKDLDDAVDQLRHAVAEASAQDRERLPPGLGQQQVNAQSIKAYLRFMYPIVAHSGRDGCEELATDLAAIGYTDIESLHSMVGYTALPFAEVARDKRDEGDTLFDLAGDIWPVRLFLAVLDENYCKEHYRDLYDRKLSKDGYRWARHLGEPVPAAKKIVSRLSSRHSQGDA